MERTRPARQGCRERSIYAATRGDPLFTRGGEHILFLKNISDDAIHAGNRQLYRIVNPTGRYDIQGGNVVTHAWLPETYTPPATVDALVTEIRQALDK